MSMKAILVRDYGGPEVLKVEEVPIPQPGPGQVVVKVESIAINPYETYIRAGGFKPPGMYELPLCLGMDAAGTVHSVGEGVAKHTPGNRVWLNGSLSGVYAQYALCDEWTVNPLSSASFDEGAALWVAYGTAYAALYHTGEIKAKLERIKPGKLRLLIHGASGGVGSAAIQIAKNLENVEIFGTAGTDEGLALLKKEGVHHAFNHKKEGYIEELKKVAGEGIDLVLEMLANVNLNKDLEVMAKRGCVVIIGNRGEMDKFNPGPIMGKQLDVRGILLLDIEQIRAQEVAGALSELLRQRKISPVVQKTYKLQEMGKAHEELMSPNMPSAGKLVVHPWDE